MMPTTNLSSDISIIWFWAGLIILLGMALVYRGARRAIRKAIRHRSELEVALVARRLPIQRMFPEDADLARLCRDAESVNTLEEAFSCEADLDMWIYRKQKSVRDARTPDASRAAAFLETSMAELRPFRDRYNESAAAVSSMRRSIPAGIIIRSFADIDFPLLQDPDFT